MFELFITFTIVVLSATFTIGLLFLLRAMTRHTRIVSEFTQILRQVSARVGDLEVNHYRTQTQTLEIELKHLEAMERLISVLNKVQYKQNELILKAAGFDREGVADLIEKHTNQGVFALLEELGTVQSLRAGAVRGERQGEREEIPVGPASEDESRPT